MPQALTWPEGDGPDLLVDDGGDATLLIHGGWLCLCAGATILVPAALHVHAAGGSEAYKKARLCSKFQFMCHY